MGVEREHITHTRTVLPALAPRGKHGPNEPKSCGAGVDSPGHELRLGLAVDDHALESSVMTFGLRSCGGSSWPDPPTARRGTGAGATACRFAAGAAEDDASLPAAEKTGIAAGLWVVRPGLLEAVAFARDAGRATALYFVPFGSCAGSSALSSPSSAWLVQLSGRPRPLASGSRDGCRPAAGTEAEAAAAAAAAADAAPDGWHSMASSEPLSLPSS